MHAGQAGDFPALPHLLAGFRVPPRGLGCPRVRPDRLLGGKAYSAWAYRTRLRACAVTTVIPKPADRGGHRKNKGFCGGRPVHLDPVRYRDRNVVERAFNQLKQRRGLTTRYDKHVLTYRSGIVLASTLP